MKQALKLYRENIKYIENSFKYDINNGIIEGTNNLIKCIKRIAFGYRKYDHFVARIFLIKGIIKEWFLITLLYPFIYQIYCLPTLFDKEPLKVVLLAYLFNIASIGFILVILLIDNIVIANAINIVYVNIINGISGCGNIPFIS